MPTIDDLTVREKQIAELVADGFIYKEIANKLRVSVSTVKSHMRNIYRKLDIGSQTLLVKKMHEKKGVQNER